MKKFIIIGYPCIGKSTLATNPNINHIIDLESSSFWIDGKRDKNWYKVYVNIAKKLCNDGNIVFVSSHNDVVNELKSSSDYITFICCPALYLKDKWIEKLINRYNQTKSDKDYKAFIRCKDYFDEDINNLLNTRLPIIKLNNIDYDLNQEIIQAQNQFMNILRQNYNKEIKITAINAN